MAGVVDAHAEERKEGGEDIGVKELRKDTRDVGY
jgi:hypothetical protein